MCKGVSALMGSGTPGGPLEFLNHCFVFTCGGTRRALGPTLWAQGVAQEPCQKGVSGLIGPGNQSGPLEFLNHCLRSGLAMFFRE